MKNLLKKIFRPIFKGRMADSTTYRLLRMNRKLTVQQDK